MNYPMYGNNQYYMQDLQNMRDRIDQQMRQMQQMQQPMQNTPANITQNFQIAPNQNNTDLDAKYAKDIDEVKNTLTLKNTFFTDKDMKFLWFKNASGEIKTYTLTEVIEQDPKDKEINELKKQIEEMKSMMLVQNNNSNASKDIPTVETKTEKKTKKEE